MLFHRGNFLGASAEYDSSGVVLFGIPMDFTTSFRPGTRFGPRQIREASLGLEEFSPVLGRSLQEICFYDAGDLDLPYGNAAASLDLAYEQALKILRDDKIPYGLGGEHLVSLGLVKAAAQLYPDLNVVHLDAHADLRDDYLGERLSHATVMRRVAEITGPERLFQLGIRSGDAAELQFAAEHTHFYPGKVLEVVDEVSIKLGQMPVYLSLDIDVVDPAFAPGTGTPEPGGCTSAEILEAMRRLTELNIVGLDLVEVSPLGDESLRTGLLAAKIVREVLLSVLK